MAAALSSIIEIRRPQIFPILAPAEIERVRRFGQTRSYRAGEALVEVGKVGPGLTIILNGHVGTAAQWQRNCDAKRTGGLHVGLQLDFRGEFARFKLTKLHALQVAAYVSFDQLRTCGCASELK